MNKFRNFLRHPRYFLSIIVLPLILGGLKIGCPFVFDPPPEPTLSCRNANLSFNARMCVVVEPPCRIQGAEWDLDMTISDSSAYFEFEPIISGDTIMQRFCEVPFFSDPSDPSANQVDYRYTIGHFAGEGFYNINISNPSALTVTLTKSTRRQVYARPDRNGNVDLLAETVGGTEPYSYIWFANEELVPNGFFPDELKHRPSRNTEYRVIVTDANQQQVSTRAVVFVENTPNDPIAEFSIPNTVVQGQPLTLDTAGSSGNILFWNWDFDWQGEFSEQFDRELKGSSGTVQWTWNTPGRKYVRLKVRALSGEFHEIFKTIRVTPPPEK